MSSIYCDLDGLVRLRFKARNLQLFPNAVARSLLSGGILSPFKGRGIDFEEVRAYQPGDDIRSIDWRVTARRSKVHTKVFREEREKPVLILLDQSHSLFFGSRLNFKSVTACEAAALLGWATLFHKDRVGGIIFNEQEVYTIRPRASKKALVHFLKQAERINSQLHINSMPTVPPEGYLAQALRHARRVSHPGTQLLLISDFRQMDNDVIRLLSQLKRHCEVMALQVSDPLERELPQPGRYMITNGHHRHVLDTNRLSQRQAFRLQQQQQLAALRKSLADLRIPLITLCTSEDTAQQLTARLSARRPPMHTGEPNGSTSHS